MKLPLETDELVTGLSVSRSGNRRPGQQGQSAGEVLWVGGLPGARLSAPSCFPRRCASRGRFLASPS